MIVRRENNVYFKSTVGSVRVRGEMSLRTGMWDGVRNGIIMLNTIYGGKKLTEERVMFSRQFDKRSRFFYAADSC